MCVCACLYTERSLGEIAASHLHQRRLEAEEKQEKGGGWRKVNSVCSFVLFAEIVAVCVRKVPPGEISAAVPPLSVAAVPRVPLMGEVGENIWRVIALNVRIFSPGCSVDVTWAILSSLKVNDEFHRIQKPIRQW